MKGPAKSPACSSWRRAISLSQSQQACSSRKGDPVRQLDMLDTSRAMLVLIWGWAAGVLSAPPAHVELLVADVHLPGPADQHARRSPLVPQCFQSPQVQPLQPLHHRHGVLQRLGLGRLGRLERLP